MTSEDLKALHDLAADLLAELDSLDPKPGDKLWWEARRCLQDSLYDLWGAFGAMGLREQEAVA